jgi:hypothetical protein
MCLAQTPRRKLLYTLESIPSQALNSTLVNIKLRGAYIFGIELMREEGYGAVLMLQTLLQLLRSLYGLRPIHPSEIQVPD